MSHHLKFLHIFVSHIGRKLTELDRGKYNAFFFLFYFKGPIAFISNFKDLCVERERWRQFYKKDGDLSIYIYIKREREREKGQNF